MRRTLRLVPFVPLVLLACAVVPAARAGEELPAGPPWKTTWLEAKQEALATGRPIFAYFTKKH